jgi:hypothetical protein
LIAVITSKTNTMKNPGSHALFAVPKHRVAGIVLFLLLAAFAPRPGGYSYTLHLNNKLVSEHYVTSKVETPTIVLNDQDMTSTLGVYFNECGEIGKGRKLSVRSADQKILKEWSFNNSTTQHDPLEVAVKEVSGLLAAGKVALYYSSERVTKPQLLTYLTRATTASKNKSASR